MFRKIKVLAQYYATESVSQSVSGYSSSIDMFITLYFDTVFKVYCIKY